LDGILKNTSSVCSAFIRGSDVYVIALAKNVFGIFENTEPFFRVSLPVPAKAIGERVLEALKAYKENIPGKAYVRGAKQPLHPFLAFSGFRSWRAFERGALHYSISSKGTEVEITPSVPAEKGGYLYQPQKAVHCPPLAEAIGVLLLEQIQRS